jgi:hypothetical protein
LVHVFHVVISLSSKGYLHNDTNDTDLSPDDAMLMWTWLFENQERIGQINLSEDDIKLLNLKNKRFMIHDHEKDMEEKVIIKEVKKSEANPQYLFVELINDNGEIRQIDNFFTYNMLHNVKEI